MGSTISLLKSKLLKNGVSEVEEPLTFTAIERSSTDMNMPDFFGELFIDILTRINFTSVDRENLLSLCHNVYKDNTTQLRILKEFDEEYQENRALWWYTCESLVYKMINKALSTQNIDILIFLCMLMRDIQNQLLEKRMTTPIFVYRSQLMSQKELDGLEHLASQANSNFLDEKEVLLMAGSIFRLISIRQENAIYIVQMTLCSADEPDVENLFMQTKRPMARSSAEYELAKKFNKRGRIDAANCYNVLGIMFEDRGVSCNSSVFQIK